jgi:hypothetical protein
VHHFLKVDNLPYKRQPGGPGYEIVYSTTAVLPYLLSLSAANADSLEASFDAIAVYEQKLLEPLLGFLTAPEQFERGVRVVGDDKPGMGRVPTVSFVVTGQRAIKSKDVVKVFDAKGGVSCLFSASIFSVYIDDNTHPRRLASDMDISTLSPWLTLYSRNLTLAMASCAFR